jgi:hypothetical protein
MPAALYDFKIEQGTSFKLSLVYKDNNEVPINITGWCARLSWLTDDGTSQAFITTNEDLELYKFEIFGSEGKLLLQFPAAITNDFTFNSAKYDLELQSPSEIYSGGGNDIIRLIYGTITISKRYSEEVSVLECQV